MKSNEPPVDQTDQRPDNEPSSPWMTAQQLATYLGLPIGSIRNLTSKGILPYYKINRLVRYKISEIESQFKSKRHFIGYKCNGEDTYVPPKGIKNGNKERSEDRPVDSRSLNQIANRWQDYLTKEKKSEK